MILITGTTFICSSDPYELKSHVCTFSEHLPRRSFFVLLARDQCVMDSVSLSFLDLAVFCLEPALQSIYLFLLIMCLGSEAGQVEQLAYFLSDQRLRSRKYS